MYSRVLLVLFLFDKQHKGISVNIFVTFAVNVVCYWKTIHVKTSILTWALFFKPEEEKKMFKIIGIFTKN